MPSPDLIAARVFVFSLLLVFSEALLPPERGCEFSITQGNYLYSYRLAAPSRSYPHGVMSEDGFYRIAVNETTLWYQLCDHMIFNHGQPKCLNCQVISPWVILSIFHVCFFFTLQYAYVYNIPK
ncbi:hypothetical protein KSP39_PZI020819 [Platanthera zijinensis]|uniref:Uncharacterized protein n=1 Tax=Platanthera zijinensis TaxID=2320716 RepID=A0AAP0FX43_9ASPA